jgi:magnesium transporter
MVAARGASRRGASGKPSGSALILGNRTPCVRRRPEAAWPDWNERMRKHYRVVNRKLVEAQDEPAPITIFTSPDEGEKRYLVDEFKVDEHTFNSALDPDELSRLEFEPEHVAIIFKRPQNYSGAEQFLFRVASAGVFLFKDRLIIVVAEEAPLFDGAQFARISSSADVILKLIARAIIHFREHLRGISMISDELQNEISRSMENKHLLNMFTLQKSLVYYVNSINSNGALLDKLKNNAAKIGLSLEESEFLDDIVIENSQCYKQAEIYSNILASLMDARASIVGNNLNVLMKTLNVITIAIMVPTFVVSAFSMNVPIPLSRHAYAFWIIMGLALLSVLSFMLYWRKKRV